jgi:Outer membrane protein beta-barrel domain
MAFLASVLLAALSHSDPSGTFLDADGTPLPTSLADEFLFTEPMIEAVPEPTTDDVESVDPYIPPPSRGPSSLQFSIGPVGGYLHAHGADRGTWLAGGQARLHFLQYFAAEASITFHENRYEHGAIHVTQYPVQLSGMLYPIPGAQFSPYLVGGGGWYYSRITYSGILAGISNQTEHTFGAHGGVGLDVRLGSSMSIDADLRYIFLDPSSSQVKSGDFNYWQATFGLNFLF